MSTLENQRLDLSFQSQRGITFIMAATVYWLCLGFAGLYTKPSTAFILGVWGTGSVFPLSILFAKGMGINIFFKNSLTPLGLWANIFQLFFFPMFFLSAKANIFYPPVIMGVLAGAHFVFYHWLYKSKTYLLLAFGLVLNSYILGLLSENSYISLGFSNAALLALGSIGLAFENRAQDNVEKLSSATTI